jgi:hypothetical protein
MRGRATGITVYNGQKDLYGRDKKISGIERFRYIKSLLTYKLSLLGFTESSGITREMYVFRYNQFRYKQLSLYKYYCPSQVQRLFREIRLPPNLFTKLNPRLALWEPLEGRCGAI